MLDFGLARMESLTPAHLTAHGDLLGTPGYMAPEQIRGQNVDFRADLFSFGSLVYEITCGSNPFEAGTRTATIARILEVNPVPLSEACHADLPALDRIVATCLSKEPSGRYGSTRELVTDLERLQAEISTSPGHDGVQRGAHVSTSRLWWEFHQAVVSTTYVLMMYPAWLVRSWLPPPWGTLLLLATLACAAASTTLRLHLCFTSRFKPSELSTERRLARVWIRWFDAGWTTSLLTVGFGIAIHHQVFAMLFVTVAIVVALASFIIEPSTTRAAFGP
jgi:hypothetical protein